MSEKITKLFDFAYYQLENYNLEKAFVTKYNGKWEATSSQKFIEEGNKFSRGLLELGVKEGDKIAIISSRNCTEWTITDFGALQVGAVDVPIYPTISIEDYEYIFNHAEISYCFVSDENLYQKVAEIKDKVPTLKAIYSYDEVKGCQNWKTVLELGESSEMQEEVEKRKLAIKEDDLATLIYTSGTTGNPKGVMLSHKNIVSNVINSTPRIPIKEKGNSKVLSFLPLCHVFERVVTYVYQYNGASIYFAESIDKMSDNLKEVKPELMTVVPRLLEKVYDGIIAKGSDLKGIKRLIFFWAVGVGLQYKPYGENSWWYYKKLALANKLVLSKWKEALGGRLDNMVAGSAPLQQRLARVFSAAKMTVMEGYGLTEASPVISVNMFENNMLKFGTIGKPIDNVLVKIAEDGEILVKGDNVMMGYYKDDELTKEVISEKGYLYTGDKGELDKDGFLKITGRKKEIFKTSGGKYIVPTVLENAMKQSRFIEQIIVVGEGQKLPAALVQINFEFVKEWARRHDLELPDNNAEIVKEPRVIERIQKEIDRKNRKFGNWEKIKLFELTPEAWTIDNKLLTPTLKPKRNKVLARYKDLYNKIYKIEE